MTLPNNILNFLNKNANRDNNSQLTTDENLFNANALDSFSVIELTAMLEETFNIKIPDEDVDPDNFQTIATINKYIEARKN